MNLKISHKDWLITLRHKLAALLFSVLIAASPVLIVIFSPPRSGGIFVAGYLTGAITAPLVVLGTLPAANELFGSGWLSSLRGVVIYLSLIFFLSAAAAFWSLYFAN